MDVTAEFDGPLFGFLFVCFFWFVGLFLVGFGFICVVFWGGFFQGLFEGLDPFLELIDGRRCWGGVVVVG